MKWLVMALFILGVALLSMGFGYKPRSCEDYRIIYNIAGIVLGYSCFAASLIIIVVRLC